jgi:hypothetical protein
LKAGLERPINYDGKIVPFIERDRSRQMKTRGATEEVAPQYSGPLTKFLSAISVYY